jgi:hypothetical protein
VIATKRHGKSTRTAVTTLQTESTDFDGSARREFAAELSFRWKTQHRTDAAFGHVAFPFAMCGSAKLKLLA